MLSLSLGDFMSYKKRGSITLSVILFILFSISVLAAGIYSLSYFVQNAKADALISECDALDNALLSYGIAHKIVIPTSTEFISEPDGGEHLHFKTSYSYPTDLKELGTVRNEHGWFSQEIDLSKFTYKVTVNSDLSQTYTLGVEMPNGSIYTSKRSGK